MTKNQIKEVCLKYEQKLIELNAEIKRESEVPKSINHLRWMCLEIISYVEADRIEKAFRWLGFIKLSVKLRCL